MHPAIDYADASEGAQLDPSILQHQKLNQLSNDPSIFELRNAYGACLMIPSSVFEKTGLFDDRFYLQLDETDFFLRAQKNGAKALCETKARITHKESASFGARVTPLKTYYITRNTLLLTEKHNRSLSGYISAVKSLYWSLSHVLRPKVQGSGGEQNTYSSTFRGKLIIAAMLGFRDYVCRRFGAASVGIRRRLATTP
jgi:GT2 family glycosyltransferase